MHDFHHHEHDHHHHDAATPMEELVAMMHYMVHHNQDHARELAGLAQQLQQAGNPAAYEEVMQAVADFDRGNERLDKVLHSLHE